MRQSRRFSNLASRIISELKQNFPYHDFGAEDSVERTVITWTRALASNNCSRPEHLRSAMDKVQKMTRSKPPTPAQYVAWYQDSMRKALGVPSQEFITKTLMAIYKAAPDRRNPLLQHLSRFGYKVYREVDVVWLKESNADRRAYEKEIERVYRECVDIVDRFGTEAVDENGNAIFIEVPKFIKQDPGKKSVKRPENWRETAEFKKGKQAIEAIKQIL